MRGVAGLAIFAWVLRWVALEVAAHAAHRLEPRPLDDHVPGPEAP